MIETFVIPAQPPIDPQERAKLLARSALQSTDFVVIKSIELQKPLLSEWINWREQLREVVRGNSLNIPPEPIRYAEA